MLYIYHKINCTLDYKMLPQALRNANEHSGMRQQNKYQQETRPKY